MQTVKDANLNVALLQLDIAWLDPQANFEAIEALLASHNLDDLDDLDDLDLLLLPETFSTGFAVDIAQCGEKENGIALQWMQALAAKHQVVVAGSVLVHTGVKKLNRFYWVWPNGTMQHYDKRHLFRLANEDQLIEAGNERKVFEIKGFRILPQVCYDLRFPVWSRNRNDYDVMVNVANWPVTRRSAWDSLLIARAIENQAYVLGVNRIGPDGKNISHSGGTAAYAFDGSEMVSAPDHTQALIFCQLSRQALDDFREKLPFHKDADNFVISD